MDIDNTVFAYIVSVHSKPGKINLQKCIAYGLKPGPMIGILKNGKPITLDNGRRVFPEDVTDKPEPTSSYLFIDCPNQDFVTNLLKSEDLKGDKMQNLKGVFHFSPLKVVQSDDYRTWVNTLKQSQEHEITHIMLNENSNDFGTCKTINVNAKLNMIAPQVFKKMLPRLRDENEVLEINEVYPNWENARIVQGITDLRYYCRPYANEIRNNDIDPMKLFQNDLENIQDLKSLMKSTETDINQVLEKDKNKAEYPQVTFLGTGSSVPSKYRNVSSILIEPQKDYFVMFDCGEGTLLQLYRLHGISHTNHILKNLKAVYISHLHADHHLGLVNIILERERALMDSDESLKKMYVLAPPRIANYLMLYHQNFQPILTHLIHVNNELLLPENLPGQKVFNPQRLGDEELQNFLDYVKLKSVRTCRVFHCPSAFAVSIINHEGFKIVYSGNSF